MEEKDELSDGLKHYNLQRATFLQSLVYKTQHFKNPRSLTLAEIIPLSSDVHNKEASSNILLATIGDEGISQGIGQIIGKIDDKDHNALEVLEHIATEYMYLDIAVIGNNTTERIQMPLLANFMSKSGDLSRAVQSVSTASGLFKDTAVLVGGCDLQVDPKLRLPIAKDFTPKMLFTSIDKDVDAKQKRIDIWNSLKNTSTVNGRFKNTDDLSTDLPTTLHQLLSSIVGRKMNEKCQPRRVIPMLFLAIDKSTVNSLLRTKTESWKCPNNWQKRPPSFWINNLQPEIRTVFGTPALNSVNFDTYKTNDDLLDYFSLLSFETAPINAVMDVDAWSENNIMKCLMLLDLRTLTKIGILEALQDPAIKMTGWESARQRAQFLDTVLDKAMKITMTRLLTWICEETDDKILVVKDNLEGNYFEKVLKHQEVNVVNKASILQKMIDSKLEKTRNWHKSGLFGELAKQLCPEDIWNQIQLFFTADRDIVETPANFKLHVMIKNTIIKQICIALKCDKAALLRSEWTVNSTTFLIMYQRLVGGAEFMLELGYNPVKEPIWEIHKLTQIVNRLNIKSEEFPIMQYVMNYPSEADSEVRQAAQLEIIRKFQEAGAIVDTACKEKVVRVRVKDFQLFRDNCSYLARRLSEELGSSVIFTQESLEFTNKDSTIITLPFEPVIRTILKTPEEAIGEIKQKMFDSSNGQVVIKESLLKEDESATIALLALLRKNTRTVDVTLRSEVWKMIGSMETDQPIANMTSNAIKEKIDALNGKIGICSATFKDQFCTNKTAPDSHLCIICLNVLENQMRTNGGIEAEYSLFMGKHQVRMQSYLPAPDTTQDLMPGYKRHQPFYNFKKMFNEDKETTNSLWQFMHQGDNWKHFLLQRESIIKELDRLMGGKSIDHENHIPTIHRMNMQIQMRFEGHYNQSKLATMQHLRQFIDIVENTNKHQGVGPLDPTKVWPALLKDDEEGFDRVENFKPRNSLTARIYASKDGKPCPQLKTGSKEIANFLLEPPPTDKYQFGFLLLMDLHTDKPTAVAPSKEPIFETNQEDKVIDKFPHTTATNCATPPGHRAFTELGITDLSNPTNSRDVTRQELFESMPWKRYRTNNNVTNNHEHLDLIYKQMRVIVTNIHNFDLRAKSLKNVPYVDKNAAAMKYHCILELQILHALINQLGKCGITVTMLLSTVAVLGNFLRSTDEYRYPIAKSLVHLTTEQLINYIGKFEELDNDLKVPLGEIVETPLTLLCIAAAPGVQNEIFNSTGKVLWDRKDLSKKIRCNLFHVVTIHKDMYDSKSLTEKQKGYISECITPADCRGSIVTISTMNDQSNPVILPENTPLSTDDQIYKIEGREWSVTANFKKTVWSLHDRVNYTSSILNNEREGANNNELRYNNTISMYNQVFNNTKTPVVESTRIQVKVGQKIVNIGHNTKSGMSTLGARANAAVLNGKRTIAPGYLITQAMGVRRFVSLQKTIGIDRAPQENYGTHWYQSGARADEYSQSSTLKKALRRYTHGIQNPHHTNVVLDPNYLQYERPTLNTLQKGVSGNVQQLDRLEGEKGITESNRVQRYHSTEQIEHCTKKLNISAKQDLYLATDHHREFTDHLKQRAMNALNSGSKGNERRVPYNVLYDMEYVDKLTRVRKYDDLQAIFMYHRNATFVLSLAQLEVMFKTHSFRNQRCLQIAFEKLWSESQCFDLMKAQARDKNETNSKEMLDEFLEEVEGLDDIKFDSESDVNLLD